MSIADNPDLVEFRIGPVDAGAARLWLEQAGSALRALRAAAGDHAFPPEVLDEFRQLLDGWRAELSIDTDTDTDTDRPFEWRAVVERSRVQRLATHWTAVARAARTGRSGLRAPEPATQPFFDALVKGVGDALQDAADRSLRPTLLAVLPGFADTLPTPGSRRHDAPAKVRVLVVDDTEDIRLLVRIGLGLEPDLDVCGEAVDGIDALEKAERLQPDVVLLDLGLPRMSGLEALPLLKERLPDARVVVFTADLGAGAVALESGADDFVAKGSPPERLAEALRAPKV